MFECVRRLLNDTERFSGKYHDEPRNFIRVNNTASYMISEYDDDMQEEDIYYFLQRLLSPDKHCFILTSFVYDVLRLSLPGYELMNASLSIVRKNISYIRRIHTLYDIYCYRKNPGRFEGKFESFPRFLEIIAGKYIIRIVIAANIQSEIEIAEAIREETYYSNDRKTILYCLTRSDNVPRYIDMNVIRILSFDDIMRWVSYCIRQSEIKDDLHAKGMFLQFRSLVNNVTGHSEGIDTDIETDDDYKEILDIVDLVLSSPENMNAALEIQDSILTIRDELREKLFDAVRKKSGFNNINIEDFISVGEKGYICVRSSPMSMWRQCRLPYSDNPNFKYPNQALMKLYDERNFDSFVNFCVEKIARND